MNVDVFELRIVLHLNRSAKVARVQIRASARQFEENDDRARTTASQHNDQNLISKLGKVVVLTDWHP